MRIYLIAALILAWYLWIRWKKSPDETARRKLLQQIMVYGLLVVIFILAATGRIHWLGAVFAALLPILKFLFVGLLRYFPWLARIYSNRNKQNNPAPATSTAMAVSEAREILGVTETATVEEIQTAYKKQIQKVHPDRGGSEYFASKLNEARDLLMKEIKG